MNALIPLLGSKKKANALFKDYLKLTDATTAEEIGTFMQSLEAHLLALEEAALDSDSAEAQAEIINRAVRLALVKCSIRNMGGKVEHNLISSLLEYGLFTPTQAIQTAAQQKHASFTYSALVNLAPLLNTEHLQAAIDVANGMSDKYRRLYALAYLVLYLPPGQKSGWLQILLDEIPSPLEGQMYVDIYLPLLPHISPQKRSELIPEMLQIMRKRTTVRIGMALLPLLDWLEDVPPEAFGAPVAELTKFRFPMHLEKLPAEDETSVEMWRDFILTLSMQDMVDGIQRGSFTETDYHLLTAHLNHLPVQLRPPWFTLALETAQALKHEDRLWHKAVVLALLSDWSAGQNLLSAGQREALLTEAQQLAWSVKDKTNRSLALVHIAPCLPPTEQLPFVQQALKKMGLPRWAKEARALKMALPLLPKDEALAWLGKVLKKAGKLQDQPDLYVTQSVLNPTETIVEAKLLDHLAKSWFGAASLGEDIILADILPHLLAEQRTPWLEQVWAQTLTEKSPRVRAISLRYLWPVLPADKHSEALTVLTEAALGISKQSEIVQISAEVGKPEELSHLVGLVPAEQKAYIVEAALNAMLAMNKSWRHSATSSMYALDYFLEQLGRIVPHLEPEMADHIWQTSQKNLAGHDTWPVAALLYPQLSPALAAEVNTWLAETVASSAPNDAPHIYALVSAIALSKSILNKTQWDAAFKAGQALTSQLQKPVFRTRAWLKLLPHFTGEPYYLTLRDTLNTLESIPDVSYRQQELFRLIRHVAYAEMHHSQFTTRNSSFMSVRILRLAAALNRFELLKALRILAPVFANAGVGPPAAQAVAEAGKYFA